MAETQIVTALPPEDEAFKSAEQEIRQAREQLTQTATQIQEKVRTDFSWSRFVERKPFTVVSIAVGVGAFIGFATASKSTAASPSPTDINSQTDFWTPIIAEVVTYAVRGGSKYLLDRTCNDRQS